MKRMLLHGWCWTNELVSTRTKVRNAQQRRYECIPESIKTIKPSALGSLQHPTTSVSFQPNLKVTVLLSQTSRVLNEASSLSSITAVRQMT